MHIRFRLGGRVFPPIVFYKVFVHHNLVDMNAFSPRDYTKQRNKQPLPRQLFLKDSVHVKEEPENWYVRYENNDWRPVSDTVSC